MRTGVAYVATTVTLVAVAIAAQALVTRIGPRVVLAAGLLFVSASIFLYSRLPVDGSYASDLLPAFLLSGIGLGLTFVPIQISSLTGVRYGEAGAASGMINTSQQIGGAVGSCRDHHDRDDGDDQLPRESRALGGDRGHGPRERLSGGLLRAARHRSGRRGADRDPAQRHDRSRPAEWSRNPEKGRMGWCLPWETAAREQRHRTKRSGRLPDSGYIARSTLPLTRMRRSPN